MHSDCWLLLKNYKGRNNAGQNSATCMFRVKDQQQKQITYYNDRSSVK